MGAGTEISLYLIRNLGAFLLLLIVVRGVLHASRVNFYNPLSQLVVRLTNPLIAPLRRVLPATGRADWATWVLAIAIQIVILVSIAWVAGERWALPAPRSRWVWGVGG
ncbi:MAG: YggT family protein, partial [Halieaceae bacterium]